MGTVLQQTDYQCEQCGATNIVAASVIYSQGTHSFYATDFSAGTNQSFSAASCCTSTSPRLSSVPFSVGDSLQLLSLSSGPLLGLRSILAALRPRQLSGDHGCAFPLYWNCLLRWRWFVALRQGRSLQPSKSYPRLYRDWEHTYVCKTMWPIPTDSRDSRVHRESGPLEFYIAHRFNRSGHSLNRVLRIKGSRWGVSASK